MTAEEYELDLCMWQEQLKHLPKWKATQEKGSRGFREQMTRIIMSHGKRGKNPTGIVGVSLGNYTIELYKDGTATFCEYQKDKKERVSIPLIFDVDEYYPPEQVNMFS